MLTQLAKYLLSHETVEGEALNELFSSSTTGLPDASPAA